MPRFKCPTIAFAAVVHPIAVLFAALVIAVLSAHIAGAETINIVDETFDDAEWSMHLVRENFITSNFSAGQELTGGMPDAYRRSHMFGSETTNNGGIGPAGALVVHFSALNSWNPSTQGEIIRTFSTMDAVAFDDRPGGQTVPTGRLVQFGFVLRQDGIEYYRSNSIVFESPNSTWHSLSHLSSQPSAYSRIDGNPGVPDFSTSGSLIEFGYLTSIGSTIPAMNNDMGVDNFRTFIEYVAIPEPATWLLCLLGLIAGSRLRR